MRFKIGDKVQVRTDLEEGKEYGSCIFVSGMEKYDGKIYEIEQILQNVQCYRLKGASYSWTDKMLEPVEEEKKMRFKVGDKVRVRKGLVAGHRYNGITFTESMKKYEGEILTIEGIKKDCYLVKGDIWNWTDEMLEEVTEKPQVKEYRIIVDGRKVIAKNDSGDIGIARCHPEDEFDLATGINLAIERLLEWPKNGDEYYTVCMDNGTGLMYANGPYSFAQLPSACRYRKNKNMFKTKEEAEEMVAKINELFAAREL